MAGFSGQNGKVVAGSTTLAQITKWAWDTEANVTEYASSSAAGYKVAIPGVKHGAGSVEFMLDDTTPPFLAATAIKAGESVTLKLYEDGTRFWTVPAVIKSEHFETDINDGPPVSGNFSFVANGQWTYPTS